MSKTVSRARPAPAKTASATRLHPKKSKSRAEAQAAFPPVHDIFRLPFRRLPWADPATCHRPPSALYFRRMPATDHIRSKLGTVPHRPGVYLMKDRFGTVIYVGKARDLRRRVS